MSGVDGQNDPEDVTPAIGMQQDKAQAATPESFLHVLEQTQERINKRSGRNLLLAVGIGLVLGLVFLGSLVFVKELFLVFLAIAIAIGAYEFAQALRAQQRDVPRIASMIGVIAQSFAAYYFNNLGQIVALGAAIAFVLLWRTAELLRKSHRTGTQALFFDFGASILVQVYLGFLLSFAALLLRHEHGELWVIAFVVTVVCVDTSALFAGVLWGKHKFVPKISPSKTWEGFLGSIVAGVIAGVCFALFLLDQPWWVGGILGLAMVASATIGDLSESLIKRDLGIKDMSGFLPGHGGFMDRLDSMLPSCLMAYIVFSAFVL
ncbi:MAG: phosphatidate cytidylyltransferase [Microbacteriaceae bacterium]